MSADTSQSIKFKYFKSPRTAIGRFVARRTMRSAVVWAFIFGAYVASKSVGFSKAYPNAAARAKIAHTFGNNIGLNALLGLPHKIDTVSGFTAWNAMSIVTIMGGIWAFLLATKYFRGEEDAGRREILLSGQSTAKGAAINTLMGLSASLIVLYLIVSIAFVSIGQMHAIGFGTQASLFFALSAVMGATIFMFLGAFLSQILPTRAKASSVAGTMFGIFFLIRAMADITSLHWLLNITPLGWIERLQPLAGSQPIWLVPIFALVLVLAMATVIIADKRDLGDSLIADKDSAKPRTKMLNSPFMATLRLNKGSIIGWLIGVGFVGIFYGLLTKAATQAFSQVGAAHKVFNKLEQSNSSALSTLYLGIVFFILMPIIMSFIASAVTKVRNDEAEGYVDNFLVRPVSRISWLTSRIFLIIIVGCLACTFSGVTVWLGQVSQHSGIPFHSFLIAGINLIAPIIFTLGVGVLAIGSVPRVTTVAAYSVVGWSFIIAMVSSGVNLNHWILDTSIMHQVALAPAVNPNWTTDAIMAVVGLGLCFIGVVGFNRRDLATE